MSNQPLTSPYYQRYNAQRQVNQGISLASKQTYDLSGQNKGENKKTQKLGSEYQNVQQPNPTEPKGVSNNYFADTKQQGNSSQAFKQPFPMRQQSITKKNEQKPFNNQRQSINSKGRDEQKQIFKDFLKELYYHESGEQIFKRVNLPISELYLTYMKSISRKIEQSKSIKQKLLNLQKTLRQITSVKEYTKPLPSQLILYPLVQMINTKKAFDKIIDVSNDASITPSTEFFNKDDIDRLFKLSSLKKQKAVESPYRQVKQINNSTYLIRYTQDSLNRILTNKYSPEIDTLKNFSPQMYKVINDLYARFNDLINKKEFPKQPQNSNKSTQKLMENIKKDVLAIRKEKSVKLFSQSYNKISMDSQLPEKLYEQVKKYYSQFIPQPQTGKQPTKSPTLRQKQQSPKEQQDNRQLYEQFQQAKQKILNLQKQNASLQGECNKLHKQIQNSKTIKAHVIGGSREIIRIGDNKKQTQNNELSKRYKDEIAEANKKIMDLQKNNEEIRKKQQSELEKAKRQLQQQSARIQEENSVLKNQISEKNKQIQKLLAQIDKFARDRQVNAKGQQELVHLRQQNNTLKNQNNLKLEQIQRLKLEYERLKRLTESNSKGQQTKNAQQLRKQKQALQFYRRQSQRQLTSVKTQLQQKQNWINNYKSQMEALLRQRQQRSKRLLLLQQQSKEQQDKNLQSLKKVSLLQQTNRQAQRKVEASLRDKDILQKQNKQSQRAIQQLTGKLRASQTKSKESQKIIQSLLNRPKQQSPKQRQLQQRLVENSKKYLQQLQDVKDKNTELLAQKAKTEKSIKSLQSQINEAKKALSERTQIITNLGKQKYALQQKSQQTIGSLNQRISEQEAKINQIQTLNMETSQQLINGRKEIEALQSKIYSLERNTGQIKEKDRLQKKTKDQEKEITNLKAEIAKLSQVYQENSPKDKEINNLRLNIQELLQKQQMNYRQIDKLRALTRSLESKLKIIEDQSSKLKQSNIFLEQELKKKQDRIVQLSKQTPSFKQIPKTVKILQQQKPRQLSNSSRSGLLQHQLLHNRLQDKQFLLSSIQSHIRLQVVHTKLLYRFDPLNKTNFHQYVDNIPNILVIIKLQNGFITAAYSQGAFILRKQSDRDGLIFSVTNRKMFLLNQPNRKAISYDEYFLIFGNSEIRLRSLQNKLFSNFGINNGYYASKGEKVAVLLGESGEREVELQTYQIYQLIFA